MNRILASAFGVINALLAMAFVVGGAIIGYNAISGGFPYAPFIAPYLERAPGLRDLPATRAGLALIGAAIGFFVASVVCGLFAVLISIDKSLRVMAGRN
jgi:hypothetical protein